MVSGPVREGVLARAKPVQIETGGRPGALHLKPWQWVGNRLTKPGEDPKWLNRLGAYTQALDPMGLVDQHPELAAVGDYTVTDPIVWVHGTVSCGLAHLRQLLRVVPYGRTVYRFEHDTFRDIDENIDQLVDQLRRKVSADTSRVILIGHSRGGLVARGAARKLAPDHPEVDFEVVTLGTPHTGTPLVNAGARVLRGMVAMTTFGIGVSPIPDPASMLMKYLLRFAKLPTGIEDMGTKSGWLRGFNAGGDLRFAMVSIGADYERGLQPESAGVKALGRLRRLFEAAGPAENDLMVQVSSATAKGTPCAMEESSGHFEYLTKDEVKTVLKDVIRD